MLKIKPWCQFFAIFWHQRSLNILKCSEASKNGIDTVFGMVERVWVKFFEIAHFKRRKGGEEQTLDVDTIDKFGQKTPNENLFP